ncbi:hypothetical protein [Naasia sp. SYSU D00948]|nr:hypothetical protein [Naasia sp. SYSU D00948]
MTKVRLISPSVSYTCDRCGHVNGHAVPDDWRPAAWALRATE